jgi:hypothetical protein
MAALGICPPVLRFHLPFICLGAWISLALLIKAPGHCRFLRLVAAISFAYAWLGILRLPWSREWDGVSYWIGFAALPLFAAGLHRFLSHLSGSDTAGRAVLAVTAVYFFPVRLVFRLLGLDLPPTPVLSPLVLLLVVAAALAAWKPVPEKWKRALSGG